MMDTKRITFLYVAVFGLCAFGLGSYSVRLSPSADGMTQFGLAANAFATVVFSWALVRQINKMRDN